MNFCLFFIFQFFHKNEKLSKNSIHFSFFNFAEKMKIEKWTTRNLFFIFLNRLKNEINQTYIHFSFFELQKKMKIKKLITRNSFFIF